MTSTPRRSSRIVIQRRRLLRLKLASATPSNTRSRSRHGRTWTDGLGVRLVLAVLALGPTAGIAVAAQEMDDLGYVSHVEGTWLVAGDTVSPYRRIQRGDSLTAIMDSEVTSSLAVVLMTGQRVRFLCDVPEDCSGPLVPADSLRETSALENISRIVKAVVSLFEKKKPDMVSTVSRGGPKIPEAVVPREGDLLNLKPLLRGHSPGPYRLTIHPLEEGDDADGSRGLSAVLEWDPEQQTHILAPGVEPGLYRIEISRATGLFAPKSMAWMLVAGEGEYEELRDRFAQAVEITGGWRGDTSESEVRAFLRTYLQHLAQSGQGSGS